MNNLEFCWFVRVFATHAHTGAYRFYMITSLPSGGGQTGSVRGSANSKKIHSSKNWRGQPSFIFIVNLWRSEVVTELVVPLCYYELYETGMFIIIDSLTRSIHWCKSKTIPQFQTTEAVSVTPTLFCTCCVFKDFQGLLKDPMNPGTSHTCCQDSDVQDQDQDQDFEFQDQDS